MRSSNDRETSHGMTSRPWSKFLHLEDNSTKFISTSIKSATPSAYYIDFSTLHLRTYCPRGFTQCFVIKLVSTEPSVTAVQCLTHSHTLPYYKPKDWSSKGSGFVLVSYYFSACKLSQSISLPRYYSQLRRVAFNYQ